MGEKQAIEIDNEEGLSSAEVQAYMLVLAQLLAIVAHIVLAVATWPWKPLSFPFIAVGLGIGLWSAITMRSSLHVLPAPNGNGLVTTGPFAFIRHPIYLGIILACLGVHLSSPQSRMWILFGFLTIVLLTKIGLEERALSKAYPDWDSYKRKTKRLIPFLL